MNDLRYLTLWTVWVFAFYGCTEANLLPETNHSPLINGNACRTMVAEEAEEVTSITSFQEGDQVFFHSQGALTPASTILTYTLSQWKPNDELQWGNSSEATQITVLYPALDEYSQATLYPNGTLTDVLYAQDTVGIREDIHLEFKHLFSMITFQLSNRLQEDFQSITLSYPKTVVGINAQTTALDLSDTEHSSTIDTPSPNGEYSFIVPPAKDIAIQLAVTTTAKAYPAKSVPSCTFSEGTKAVFNVGTDEKGISTVAEFIEFTQLINETYPTEEQKNALARFGETVDGITTYYLLNDLDFEGKTYSGLEQIGEIRKTGAQFKDIFDGQGHTISNLTPAAKQGTAGLFGKIGENSTVKNLHLKNCAITFTTSSPSLSSGAGLLVGSCLGTIINCSVQGGSIDGSKYTKDLPIGGIAGTLRGGTIINSYIVNTKLTGEEGEECGGICGLADTGSPSIINCYIYGVTLSKGTRGWFYGKATNATIENGFYAGNSTIKTIGSGTGNTDQATKFTTEQTPTLYQLLNNWIEANQSNYPTRTFTKWQEGTSSIPAIFLDE